MMLEVSRGTIDLMMTLYAGCHQQLQLVKLFA
jgi:hypothetical protein